MSSASMAGAAGRDACCACEPPNNHGAHTARPMATASVTERRLMTVMEVLLPERRQACDAQDLSPGEWGALGSNRPGDSM